LIGNSGGHLDVVLSRDRRGIETPRNWRKRAVGPAPECSIAVLAENSVLRFLSEGEELRRNRR
jgi:hypothetical protein